MEVDQGSLDMIIAWRHYLMNSVTTFMPNCETKYAKLCFRICQTVQKYANFFS